MKVCGRSSRDSSVLVENMRKEDAEAGKLLNLASTTEKVLSDQTFKGFRAKRDTAINYLVTTSMNGVVEVLAQADSSPTGVLPWVDQLENSDAGKRLLAATNPDIANDGDGVGTSGGGHT